MAKIRYTPETIIRKLSEAGAPRGQSITQVVRQLGFAGQTFDHWRKKYCDMRVDQ